MLTCWQIQTHLSMLVRSLTLVDADVLADTDALVDAEVLALTDALVEADVLANTGALVDAEVLALTRGTRGGADVPGIRMHLSTMRYLHSLTR